MNKITVLSGVALAALAWCAPAIAQDEGAMQEEAQSDDVILPIGIRTEGILVRANRDGNNAYLERYTGSASIVERREMVDRQVRDLADVLRDVPGVSVSGVAGQTQLRLRGSEANHVLVLVDGIEVSDPFAGEFDIGTVQAEIGSKVEVLRGPQSALYGADAIGGVVAYESASGGELPGFGARVEGGTQGTINGAARYGIAGYGWNGAISATVASTDGQPNARGGSRDIGRDTYSLSAKANAEVVEGFQVRAVGRINRSEGDYNESDFDTTAPTFGLVIDSPGTRFESEAIYGLVGARHSAAGADWTNDLSFQVADIFRDTFGAFGRTSGSEGDRLKASFVSAYQIEDTHFLTFAADWEREGFRNDDPFGSASDARQEIENVGLVGEYRLRLERFDLSAAVRHDINDRFADATTFRVGAGFDLTATTRIRAAAGSGTKNPGFFELFGYFDGQYIGNESLEPEKSTGWEIGIDQRFADDRMRLSVTYFDSSLENEIFTTYPAPEFIATPANQTSDSDRRGVEVELSGWLGSGFSIDAAYTYLDAVEDGVEEVRRPDHIASAAVSWQNPEDTVSAGISVRHNGEADDLAFTDPSYIPVRVTLDDYTLVNLYGRVDLTQGIELFGRLENLLDQRYEQVFSFVSPGRSAVAGIAARF